MRKGQFVLLICLVLPCVRQSVRAQEEFVQDMNTAGLWHFNEEAGSDVYDFSGNGAHGILENGAFRSADGKFGSCIVFNGVEQRVRIFDHPILDMKETFTIDAWVMLFPSNNRSVIVSKWNSTGKTPSGQYLYGFDSGSHLYFAAADSSQIFTIVSDTIAPFDQWMLVSAVFDQGKMGLFLNGEQVASGKAPFTSILTEEYETDDLFIGDLWTNEISPYSMEGRIDEVRISDVVRWVVTHIEDQSVAYSPHAMVLTGNYPNPCNPGTIIYFTLSQPESVILSVHTLLGEQVRLLTNEFLSQGEHRVGWDGRDDAGRPMPSGVYLCRLRSELNTQTHKMILVR